MYGRQLFAFAFESHAVITLYQMGHITLSRYSFQILRKGCLARNLKRFDFYYFCVLNKPPSRYKYSFSKSVFRNEKTVKYHTGHLTPMLKMLSYPTTFRKTFAYRARTCST